MDFPKVVRMKTVQPFAVLAAVLAFAGAPLAPVGPGTAGFVSPVAAQDAGASDFVRSLGDQVIQVLKNEPYQSRKQKLHDVFTSSFDVDTMAKFAAGTYWRRA